MLYLRVQDIHFVVFLPLQTDITLLISTGLLRLAKIEIGARGVLS